MRIRICAVGRLRKGPESSLLREYLLRFDRIGRPLGLGPADMCEVEDRKGADMAAEAALLMRRMPDRARLCVLDERGRMMSSPRFAGQLTRWRDDGARDAVFMIGGAEGTDPALRARAEMVLSFGQMVWP
ncbi:MAG: 23S rRNA (pseudouridine(1915)-N(3))-methyltransferase RlmH, partial [Pseudomonadota bacterium]